MTKLPPERSTGDKPRSAYIARHQCHKGELPTALVKSHAGCSDQGGKDASKKKFDVVLFWVMDGFSRKGIRATLNYIQLLEQRMAGLQEVTRNPSSIPPGPSETS
jgi:hypothetical protein